MQPNHTLPFLGAQGITPAPAPRRPKTKAPRPDDAGRVGEARVTGLSVPSEELPAAIPQNMTFRAIRCSYNVRIAEFGVQDRAALTVSPRVPQQRKRRGAKQHTEWHAWTTGRLNVHIPRYFGLHRFGAPPRSHNLCVDGRAIALRFSGTLRAYQAPAVEAVVARLADATHPAPGCCLEADCGTGKTVMAAAVIARLGVATAVVVHKDFLMRQWQNTLCAHLPQIRVGVVRGDVAETGPEYDVTLVMLQTAVRQRHPASTWNEFGLVIVDECHHICARWFSTAMSLFPSRRRLGLTATVARADGLGHMLMWYLGPIAYRLSRSVSVLVDAVEYVPRGATKGVRASYRARTLDYVATVSNVVAHVERTVFVASVVRGLAAQGRRIIVFSSRREHIDALHGLLGEALSGVYRGETTKRAKRKRDEEATRKQVVLSTVSMGEEGLDIPALDTAVLVTPRSGRGGGLKQCVGRILRSCPDKAFRPLVVDIWDKVFAGIFFSRVAFYRKNKMRVSRYTSQTYPNHLVTLATPSSRTPRRGRRATTCFVPETR